MLEINRKLYLEEDSAHKSEGYEQVKSVVAGWVEVIRKELDIKKANKKPLDLQGVNYLKSGPAANRTRILSSGDSRSIHSTTGPCP